MTTQTLPATTETGRGNPPMLHTFCVACNPIPKQGSVAICGYVSRGGPKVELDALDKHPLCVVCVDLLPHGCPKCGAGR